MNLRTSSKIVTFARPFRLSALEHVQPPGSYTIETDEERIETRTVPAYRRVGTFIRVPAQSAGSSSQVMIDPTELEAALARDAAPEPYGPETADDQAARQRGSPS